MGDKLYENCENKNVTHTCILLGVVWSFHQKMMAPPSDMAVKPTPNFQLSCKQYY